MPLIKRAAGHGRLLSIFSLDLLPFEIGSLYQYLFRFQNIDVVGSEILNDLSMH